VFRQSEAAFLAREREYQQLTAHLQDRLDRLRTPGGLVRAVARRCLRVLPKFRRTSENPV
jgi:hypothetical protein